MISQYMFSSVLFVVNNTKQFRMNSKMHRFSTRNNSNFHQPLYEILRYVFTCKVNFIYNKAIAY
jgi:hypothetical protein